MLREKLQRLIVTPLQKEGERTKAICSDIISENFKNCNILVTGANGQVGREIKQLVINQKNMNEKNNSKFKIQNSTFYFATKNQIDITNKNETEDFVKTNNINVIINCAAYTAVDKAEEEAELADAINHLSVKYLAQLSKEQNISLIHISTDYVFDGKNYKPYKEDDQTNPQGVYGETKLRGEQALLEVNPKNSIIIRTSWVYSSFGNNFTKTMLRLGKEKDSLGVIYDQIGTPTYARDLAKAILDILPKIDNQKVEIYHYSNEGVVSWYDFAKEIMRMAKLDCIINPIETKEYPTPATRPHYSLLNKIKIKKEFGITIPYWKDSLDICLRVLGERK